MEHEKSVLGAIPYAPPRDETEDIPPDVAEATATFVNGFYVTVSGGFTRIAFAESLPGNLPRWRWAVVLPTEDARNLADVLMELTTPIVQPEPAGG